MSDNVEDMDTDEVPDGQQPLNLSPAEVNQPSGTPQGSGPPGFQNKVHVQHEPVFPDPTSADAGSPLRCPTEPEQVFQEEQFKMSDNVQDIQFDTADGNVELPPDSTTAESAITSPQDGDEGLFSLFTLSLKWSSKPQPWTFLQLALQPWFRQNLNIDLKVVKVFDDGKAVIRIECPPARTMLDELCGQLLTRKSESVTILSADPTSAELKKQLDDPSKNVPSSLPEIEPQTPVPSGAQGGPGLTASGFVSLPHYWYLSNIYKEQLLEIMKANGVQLVPELTVTFKEVRENGDPQKALNAFTDLIRSVNCCSSVVPRKNVDEDQWLEALAVSKKSKNRLLLTVSPEEVVAWGPKDSRDAFTDYLIAVPQTDTTTPMEEEESVLQDTPIKMTIKDSPLENGLGVEKSHWKEMTTSSSQKVKNIQTTFNVDLIETDNGQGEVQVKAYYRAGENLSMEIHAISALLRLYQKTATSPLKHMDGDDDSEETTNGFVMLKKEDGANAVDKQEENCPICIAPFTNKKRLDCKHEFCEGCLRKAKESMGPICPVCREVFGMMEGDQPEGNMTWKHYATPLLGFPKCGQIVINYDIPSGCQTEKHPNPGKFYSGVCRTAYLPDNREGKEVLHLLKRAFDQKLIFTIGTSRTTGMDNQVTWNDIHHKTSTTGGPQNFGYPDPQYLRRVKEELEAKGIK